jgi:hypothetical protein
MRAFVRCLIVPCAAYLLAACASSAKLAEQSNEALARGDVRKAYDRALSAVEKDPANQGARAAYDAASRSVAADLRQRVVALAVADTQGAADLALELRRIRLEVVRHQSSLETAPDYERAERTILASAARAHYRMGDDAMATHRPKSAVDEFTRAQRYDDGSSDVAARLDAAFKAAVAHVWVLPFADGVDAPGLSQDVDLVLRDELSRRVNGDFRFTRFVNAIDLNVSDVVTRNLSHGTALILAARAGADRVIVGRIFGLRADNSQREVTLPLYHRVERKDSTGATVVRWDESSLKLVTRERQVTVRYEFDVLEVATGAVLAHRAEKGEARVRVAWSDYRPGDDVDRYALLPPDVRKSDPGRARKVDAQWRDHMGSWSVEDVLRQSRDQRSRSRYSSRYRGEFYGDTRQRPVWLGEVPTENDLAYVALRDIWRPVLVTLRELDARD